MPFRACGLPRNRRAPASERGWRNSAAWRQRFGAGRSNTSAMDDDAPHDADDDALIRLAVPVGPDDHVRGPAEAPVTLVEYGDFECPYCGVAYPVVKELERRYGERLRVVFRSFPLQQHRHAQAAAEAAEFAADHDTFWELHDTLFEHQRALDEPHLLGYARTLGLDDAALAHALREHTYAGIVEDVKQGGEESGIPGTPAFFLNGVLFEDEPALANFTHAIDWLLERG
jgi:protein-disulfide isomerase